MKCELENAVPHSLFFVRLLYDTGG